MQFVWLQLFFVFFKVIYENCPFEQNVSDKKSFRKNENQIKQNCFILKMFKILFICLQYIDFNHLIMHSMQTKSKFSFISY